MAYTFKNYQESDAVKQYRDMLQQVQNQKPGEFQSQWTEKQQQAAKDYMNRPDFKYSLNGDPLYQQYKEQYQRQGKMAMQDTIGKAAAMSGGYGTSYGQMAGQQVYDRSLQQLNDRVPELYNLALSKYQMDGQQLMDKYNMASAMEGQDYTRYQDKLSAWQNDRDYATNRYDNERSTDYNLWADMDSREYSRFQDEQKLAQAQVEYLLSLGIMPDSSLLELAGYSNQYVQAKVAQNTPQYASDSYSGGGSGRSRGTNEAAKISGVIELGRGPISMDTLTSLVASGDVKATEKNGVIKVSNISNPSKKNSTNATNKTLLGYGKPLDLLTKKF